MATNKADEQELPTPPTRQQLLAGDEHYTEPAAPPQPGAQVPMNFADPSQLQHSGIMGGSTAKQRINCPGSYAIEAAIPDGPESEYATQGSVYHAAMELMLAQLDPDDDDYEERYRKVLADLEGNDLGFGDEWAITQDGIRDKVMPAWHAFIQVLSEYNLVDWFVEQRVSLDTVINKAFGTVDLLAKDDKNRLHVLDWKFGDGVVVPVEGNEQLTFYAAGALYDEDPELREFTDDITGVVLHVVQPRVGDDVVLHTWETDEDFIEKFLDQAVNAVDLASKPDAPVKPGDHCKWCKGKQPSKKHGGQPACPAHRQGVVEALNYADKDLVTIDLADAMRVALLLKEWTAKVFNFAQEQMEQGAQVPGFKLVKKRSAGRKYTDEAEAERILKKKKVKVADMYAPRKLLTPTQLEKQSKEAYAHIETLVHSPSSGVTVVPDTDKRPAVVDSFELLSEALPDPKK